MDQELLREVLVWAVFALGGISLAGWLWLRMGLADKLLPPQRERAVPWGGVEMGAAVFLFLLTPGVADACLHGFGVYDFLYGPQFLKQTDGMSVARRGLWVSVVGLPLQLGAILLLFRSTSDARLYQLGLTRHRLGRNVVLGLLAWLALSPVVLVLGGLVTMLFQAVFQIAPEKHPFESLARSELIPAEWVILVLAALVAAPVSEEFLFRGVIQRYLMSRWWGGDVALAGAYVLAILMRWNGLKDAVEVRDYGKFFLEAQPALFVLLMLAVYVGLRQIWPAPVFRTIYGVALLFAAAHSFAWPSPVPLFFLGLALGWLAQRTQSLAPGITLHALFNSIAVITLLLPQQEAQNGKAETTAPRRPAAVSTSSLVPGS